MINMIESITNSIQKEKRKQLFYSVAAAILVSLLVLSASYGLSLQLDDGSTDRGTVDRSPDDDTGANDLTYVNSLVSSLQVDFTNEDIAGFAITGNITPAIHPSLITSFLVATETGWSVTAFVLNETTADPYDAYQTEFYFTNAEVSTTHDSFLNSLNSTEEVPPVDVPQINGSIPLLLFYTVFLVNGSGYEFVWAGFQDLDIMVVTHFSWTLPAGTPSADNLRKGEEYDEHYVSPLSAFDPFLDQLQTMFSNVLDV